MKQLLLLVGAFIQLAIQAQQPDLVVFAVNGKVSVVRPGTNPLALTQKQPVFKKDIIVLEKASRVILSDKYQNMIEVRTAGRFSVEELMKESNHRAPDKSTSKYLKLLYHELFDPDHDYEKFKNKNITSVHGGVTRSDDFNNRIAPADGIKTSFRSIVFRWHSTSPSSKYSLSIFDEEKEILTVEVSDTLKKIDLAELTKSKEGKYYWNVSSKDGKREDDTPSEFELITVTEEQRLLASVKTGDADSSLEGQLQKIDELDRMGLVYAAAATFDKLVKIYPDDKALLKSYILYLLENGLDEEAAKEWK